MPELPTHRDSISIRAPPARDADATEWGQAVNRPVLSRTQTPVLSGTANPSYQEPQSVLTPEALTQNRAPNFTNKESFGFLLTARNEVALVRNVNIAVMP